MRAHRILTLSVLASIGFTAAAAADDRLHLTPPLYREQARATQAVRAPSDLTTTPQPVLNTPSLPRTLARQASAETVR